MALYKFVTIVFSCCLFLFVTQAKSTRDPMDLEAMFEQKLAELQRGNTSDSLKEHEKYVELQEHIQNAIQSAHGKYITIIKTPFSRGGINAYKIILPVFATYLKAQNLARMYQPLQTEWCH